MKWSATIDDVVITTTGWTVKIQVENTHSTALPGCWTDVYLDLTQPPQPGQLSSHYAWTPPLAPSESVWLEVDVPAGSWVHVKADSTELKSEAGETDNIDVFVP